MQESIIPGKRDGLSRRKTAGKVFGTLKVTTPGLPPHHAYAVLNYRPAADCVELWNPHGQTFQPAGPPGAENGYVTTSGVFTIPLKEFTRQISGMTFEVADGPEIIQAGAHNHTHTTVHEGFEKIPAPLRSASCFISRFPRHW